MCCFRSKTLLAGVGVAALLSGSAWAGGQAGTPPVITVQPQSQIVQAGSEVALLVQASSASHLSYRWWYNGRPLLYATQAVHTIENVQLTNAGVYHVVVMNVAGSVTSSNVSLTVLSPTVLFPFGSAWAFRDEGTDPDAAWRELTFDDSGWSQGKGQFGYGDGDEMTTVSYGSDPSNKHIATYFRRKFDIIDPSRVTNLFLQLLRDDGVVVYLNGVELVRDNMPNGPVGHLTLAVKELGDEEESKVRSFQFDPIGLLPGQNVLAAEIHQAGPGSSDLSFDLALSLGILPVPGTLDPSFNAGQGPDGPINALALQEDGNLVIGGAFDSVNGVTRAGLARLFQDGRLDLAFAALFETDGEIRDLVVLENGELVVVGEFANVGLEPRGGVAKLNPEGFLTPWLAGVGGRVLAAQVRCGVLYLAGALSYPDGSSGSVAALDLATGDLLGWETVVRGVVSHLWVTDRFAFVAGEFDLVNGEPRNKLASLDRWTGELTSWQPEPDGPVFGLAAGATEIYLGGGFTQVGLEPRQSLASVEGDLGAPGSWNPGLNGQVNAILIWRDLVYAGGAFGQAGANSNFAVLSRNVSATLTPVTSASFDGPVHRMVVQPNGGLVVAGEFFNVDGIPRRRLARLVGKPPAAVWPPALHLVESRPEAFRIRVSGPSGRRLSIESTTDFSSWSRMISGNAPDGVLEFTDTKITGTELRFYRATVD